MDPNFLKQMEAQRNLQSQYGGPAAPESAPQQESFMNPQETEWANMMIAALNQLGGMSNNPSYHQNLAGEYLNMLGSLRPEAKDPKSEALEMIELGQMLGDSEMSKYGLNALRGVSGMDFMPIEGTPEYRKGVEEEALAKLFEDKFPVVGDEEGRFGEEDMRNLQLQLQAQENPNLVNQYMDTSLNPWEWLKATSLSGTLNVNPWSKKASRRRRNKELEKAGFDV